MKCRMNTKITFRYMDIVYFLLVACMLFVSATSYLKIYIIPSTIVRGGISAIMCGLVFVLNLKQKRYNGAVLIWTIFAILIFIWNSDYIEEGNYNIILIYISMLLLVCCAQSTFEWIELYLALARYVYLFYAICTIGFYFTPSFYVNTVAPLFPETQNRLIRWYKEGCMPGLTNHYSTNGMFLTVGTIILIATIIERKKTKKDIFTLTIFVVALLLTGKRAHTLFTIVASIVIYYYHLSNEKKTRVLKLAGISLLGVGAFMVLLYFVPALSTFVVRIIQAVNSGETIDSARTSMWKWAFEEFKQHPLWGIGWGNFRDLTVGRLAWTTEAHAHNTYFQLLCETGIVGFSIYIIGMAYMLHGALRTYAFLRKFPNENEKERVSVGFALGFQVFFLLYCITGNPLYDYEMFVPYFISWAVTDCYKGRFCIR